MGVFGDYAYSYHEIGLTVVPLSGKSPLIEGWTKLTKDSYSDELVESLINQFPDAGIGLVLGDTSNICAVDLDSYEDDEKKQLFYKKINAIDIGKDGMKGGTLFYQGNGLRKIVFKGSLPEKFKNLPRKDWEKHRNKLEILSNGQQTVLPPSKHPDTGKAYVWINPDKQLNNQMVIDSLPVLDIEKIKAAFHEVYGHPEEFEKSSYAGRNDRLTAISHKLFHKGRTPQDVISEIILADEIKHADSPLFSDHSEWPIELKTIEDRATHFVFSNYKSYLDFLLREKPENKSATTEADKYPSMSNGFFDFNSSNNRETPKIYELAHYLKEEMNLKVNDAFMYYYNEGYYHLISKLGLKCLIVKLTKEKATKSHIDNFYDIIKSVCYISVDEFQEPDGMLNLSNGVLDIDTNELLAHSSEFYFRYKLPHIYDAEEKCDNWIKFLNYVFEDKQELVDLSAEIFGYIIAGGSPWLHKAFIPLGEGRNGKSTWADMLKYILGQHNYCSVPLQNLGKPFSVVMADGKLANIIGETSGNVIDGDFFKIAVGGEELIASHKGMPEYMMKFNAKIVSLCNSLPNFKDSSAGNYEKLCIIPFDRYIDKAERIPNYAEDLLYPEVSGVINWALDGLKRLKKRRMLPEILSTEETIKSYKIETNSVSEWIDCTVKMQIGHNQNFQFKDYYLHYSAFCRARGRHPYTLIGFSRKALAEVKKSKGVIFTRSREGFTIHSGIEINENLVNSKLNADSKFI